MKYRPKGWDAKKIATKYLDEHEVFTEGKAVLAGVEAGADAMLKALKNKIGSRRNKGNSGWLVFIPEGDDDVT